MSHKNVLKVWSLPTFIHTIMTQYYYVSQKFMKIIFLTTLQYVLKLNNLYVAKSMERQYTRKTRVSNRSITYVILYECITIANVKSWLLHFFPTLSVTSKTPESTFFVLNLTKNCLRSTTNEERQERSIILKK